MVEVARRNTAAATRQAIVSAAATLFDRKGYHNVRMDDIAVHLGLSKGAIYHHFASKDEILAVLHGVFMDELERLHALKVTGLSQPAERVYAIIASVMELMATHREYVRVFFEHHRELYESRKTSIRARRLVFQSVLEAALEDGVRDGSFVAHDPRTVALSIFGMCNWSYQWFRGDVDQAHQVCEEMATLALRGLQVRQVDVPTGV